MEIFESSKLFLFIIESTSALIFLIILLENFNLAIFGPKGLIIFIITILLGLVDPYILFQDQIFSLLLGALSYLLE